MLISQYHWLILKQQLLLNPIQNHPTSLNRGIKWHPVSTEYICMCSRSRHGFQGTYLSTGGRAFHRNCKWQISNTRKFLSKSAYKLQLNYQIHHLQVAQLALPNPLSSTFPPWVSIRKAWFVPNLHDLSCQHWRLVAIEADGPLMLVPVGSPSAITNQLTISHQGISMISQIKTIIGIISIISHD